MTDNTTPEMLGDMMRCIDPDTTPFFTLLAETPVGPDGVFNSPVQRFCRTAKTFCDYPGLAGAAPELARQKVLKALAQKRDIEAALLSSRAPSPEIEGVTPARMWSLGYEPTIYQRGELTEATFKGFLAAMFAAGANTSHCFAPPVEGEIISHFCGLQSETGDDVYLSDFSAVNVATTVFAERRKLIFIDSGGLKLGVHKPMQCVTIDEHTFKIEMEVTPLREEGCVIGVFEVVE